MNKLLQIILSVLIFACETKQNKGQIKEKSLALKTDKIEVESQFNSGKDSIVITDIINGIKHFDYEFRRWNGVIWEDYEVTGNADTALTIHAYRLITSNTKPEFIDWATFTNLYEKSTSIKRMAKDIFSSENDPQLISKGIDQINKDFMDYAKTQVANDIEKFGQSDGPYFTLVERFGKE